MDPKGVRIAPLKVFKKGDAANSETYLEKEPV